MLGGSVGRTARPLGDGRRIKVSPQDIVLPRNLADTPRTREDFAKYLAEITFMDGQVGEILKTLEDSGKAKNTLVIFTSEQGAQFPGCKWTNWDTGIHTALITRWPEKIKTGRTDAIVQYADILPTLLEAAGPPKLKQQAPRTLMGQVFYLSSWAKRTLTENLPLAATIISRKDRPIRFAQ